MNIYCKILRNVSIVRTKVHMPLYQSRVFLLEKVGRSKLLHYENFLACYIQSYVRMVCMYLVITEIVQITNAAIATDQGPPRLLQRRCLNVIILLSFYYFFFISFVSYFFSDPLSARDSYALFAIYTYVSGSLLWAAVYWQVNHLSSFCDLAQWFCSHTHTPSNKRQGLLRSPVGPVIKRTDYLPAIDTERKSIPRLGYYGQNRRTDPNKGKTYYKSRKKQGLFRGGTTEQTHIHIRTARYNSAYCIVESEHLYHNALSQHTVVSHSNRRKCTCLMLINCRAI